MRIQRFLLMFFVLLSLPWHDVMAQNHIVTDSLMLLLNDAHSKKRQMELLKCLSEETERVDLNTSIDFARRGLELANSEKDKSAVAQFNSIMARNYYFLGNYREALDLYLKALAIYESLSDARGIIGVNVNLGAIYDRLADDNKALSYYQNALRVLNTDGQGILSERPEFKTILYNNIASVYNRMNDYARSEEYSSEALQSALSNNDLHTLGVIYNNMGAEYVRKGDYPRARSFFCKSVESRQKIGDMDGLAKSYLFMVDYFIAVNQNDSAEFAALKAQELAVKIGSLETQQNISRVLFSIYENQNKPVKALEALKLYNELNDSLRNESNLRQTFQLQSNYELAKYERHVELEKQRTRFVFILIILFLIFIIVVVVLLLILRNTRNKKTLAQKQQLETEVELKNREFATNVLYLVRKNELINQVAKQLMGLKENMKPELRPSVQRIIFELQSEVDNEVWNEFEYRFQQVHQDFYTKLRSSHPDLTPSEERLCAFLKLNMSSKEIASITHQNVKSIEVSRARIRKKFNLTNTDANLVTYLSDF